jgi:hypothetical protein
MAVLASCDWIVSCVTVIHSHRVIGYVELEHHFKKPD